MYSVFYLKQLKFRKRQLSNIIKYKINCIFKETYKKGQSIMKM